MEKLLSTLVFILLFIHWSHAQFFQKTDQRGISNEYTNTLLLPDSTVILSERIQESGPLRSALKAENINGEVLWEIISEDTTEVLLYQNLIQIDENTFGILGYYQSCCDCTPPVSLYEMRSIQTGELILQVEDVLNTGPEGTGFYDNSFNVPITSWGFSVVKAGFATSSIYNVSDEGELLNSFAVLGTVFNLGSLNGDLMVVSQGMLYRLDIDGNAVDSVSTDFSNPNLASSDNALALEEGGTLVLYDSNLDEIASLSIIQADYLMSGSASGFTFVSDEKFYRIDESGSIQYEFDFNPISGFKAENIAAIDDIYVLAGAKVSESFSIDQIKHKHGALQIHDNGGSANLWHTDLTLSNLLIEEIELVQGGFYVNYNATVSVTVTNTGSFPVNEFYLNHAQGGGICFPSIQRFYQEESIPHLESLNISLSGLSGYTLPGSGDSLFLKICVFATNPMDQMDWDLSDDSACSEDYYTLSIDDIDLSRFVKVFPNPSSDFITIESMLQMESLQIFNTGGKQVKAMNIPGMNSARVEGLPGGLYLIQLQTEKGPLTKKVIITN